LVIETRAHVLSLKFEGRRVTGVEYNRGGEVINAQAKAEVVLSAGAIGSPQILQCSGVGDGALLQKLGIPVVHELKGVGQSLQDHLQVRLVYKTNKRTLNDEVNNPLQKMWIGMQYILTRTGPMTLAASQVAIFTRSDPSLNRPDIQFHMQPLSADKPGDGPHKFSAFTASVCQLRPESRGSVSIVSPDPKVHPRIDPNYLATERDQQVAIAGVKVARRIVDAPAIRGCIVDEYVPGRAYQTEEELLQAVRLYSQTIYHPTSTCKMGNDSLAVVDERLKVRGIEGLRVADASIMPEIVSGNTNAPTIMIGEKASDMILEDNR
ncbi:MAG: GMC oxidoreductase, partial [Gammaproteobacteria bacterium]|nr:GMC oxidoreductase [Gammaproteobacteria bacterium]